MVEDAAQLGALLVRLLEQPRVVQRGAHLVGERAEHLQLAVGEPDVATEADAQHAEACLLRDQRRNDAHGEPERLELLALGGGSPGGDDLEGLPLAQHPGPEGPGIPLRLAFEPLDRLARCVPENGRRRPRLAVHQHQLDELGLEQRLLVFAKGV